MNHFRMLLMVATLGLAATAFAGDTPDFAGTWELNPKKGENLGMVAAVKETLVITQTADQLVIDYTDVFQGKTTTRQVSYDLSGAGAVNFAAMGDRSETVSTWDGDKLITLWTSEGAIAGTAVVRTETRSVAADGSSMTVATARGDNPPMVLVYEKQ